MGRSASGGIFRYRVDRFSSGLVSESASHATHWRATRVDGACCDIHAVRIEGMTDV